MDSIKLIVVKINNVEVSGLSHHEVRQMLLNSQKENVVVELKQAGNCRSTRENFLLELAKKSSAPSSPANSFKSSPKIMDRRKFSSIGIQTENHNVVNVDSYEPEEHLVVEQYLPTETDVEEFIRDIKRNDMGSTISYSSGIDATNVSDSCSEDNVEICTEVYIKRDSEVNTDNVHDDSDKSNSVTFDVCHCSNECKSNTLLNSDDYFESDEFFITEDEQANFLTNGSLTHLDNRNVQAHILKLNKEIQSLNYRVQHLFMSATSVNGSSCKSPESKSEPRTPEHVQKSPRHLTMEREIEHIYETIPDDDLDELYCDPYDSKPLAGRAKPETSSNLPQTPQRPELVENFSKINIDSVGTKSPLHQKTSKAYLPTRSPKMSSKAPDKDTLRQSVTKKCSKFMPKTTKMPNSQSVPISLSQAASSSTGATNTSNNTNVSNNTTESRYSQDLSQSAISTLEASKTMYTNIVNLQRTMLLQQKLYQQAMKACNEPGSPSNRNSSSNAGVFVAPNLEQYKFVNGQQVYRSSDSPDDTMMRWKVKRRGDGSKYIVKRSLSEDKKDMDLLTTDDDAMSEIKLGKFWSKADRKKHLEKSKERRHRMELINQQLIQSNIENSSLHRNVAGKQLLMQKHSKRSPPNTPEILNKGADTILSVSIL